MTEVHGNNFFMLLMGSIGNNSSLLDGPPDRRILRHNTSAFQVCLGKAIFQASSLVLLYLTKPIAFMHAKIANTLRMTMQLFAWNHKD